jgi:hypothetical protein
MTDKSPYPAVFHFSDTEAKRMRRGSLLFPLLVLPFAAIFALDSSKSQPVHFIIVMSIAILVSSIFVAISRAGASAQIRASSDSSLSISSDRLIWTSNIGQSEVPFNQITSITATRRRGKVRAVVVQASNGTVSRIEGYDNMDVLHAAMVSHLPPDVIR